MLSELGVTESGPGNTDAVRAGGYRRWTRGHRVLSELDVIEGGPENRMLSELGVIEGGPGTQDAVRAGCYRRWTSKHRTSSINQALTALHHSEVMKQFQPLASGEVGSAFTDKVLPSQALKAPGGLSMRCRQSNNYGASGEPHPPRVHLRDAPDTLPEVLKQEGSSGARYGPPRVDPRDEPLVGHLGTSSARPVTVTAGGGHGTVHCSRDRHHT